MKKFFDLFADHSSPEGWADPAAADREFAELIAVSPFRVRRPDDPIPARGVRLLLGAATWSGYDMRLLDVASEAISHGMSHLPIVEVFNVADCQQQRDFARYIDGLDTVAHTPVGGLWRDGQLEWSGQGHAAREFIAGLFGSNSAAIVAFVKDWMQARGCVP